MHALSLTETQLVSGGDSLLVDVTLDYSIIEIMDGLQAGLDAAGVNYQFDTAGLYSAMGEQGIDPNTMYLSVGATYTF